ncbi:hypothetical protein J2W15_002522 [Pseudarthrobacter sulfonivorans]|nr:hypothetical protein [Pseudarthrobacter sulfonivorans]
MLGFAGLYEFWADPSLPEDDPARWLLSCTVLTTTTQDALGTLSRGGGLWARETIARRPEPREVRASGLESAIA